MISARRVSQSIRSWSYLGAMPFVAALAVAACGGKVVVDGNGAGEGGAGGTSESSATVNPSTGTQGQNTCDAAVQHFQSCGGVGTLGVTSPCEGKLQCRFACVLDTSCEKLVTTDPAATQQLLGCVLACG